MSIRKRVKKAVVKKKATKPSLVYTRSKWVINSTDIKILRDRLKTETCPICGIKYGINLQQPVLDHDHQSGYVRGVCCGACNLFLGRLELYFRKLLSKRNTDLLQVIENITKYLRHKEDTLHFAVVNVEKRKINRWKKETLYTKLKEVVDMRDENNYSKEDLVYLWLNNFIQEKETK